MERIPIYITVWPENPLLCEWPAKNDSKKMNSFHWTKQTLILSCILRKKTRAIIVHNWSHCYTYSKIQLRLRCWLHGNVISFKKLNETLVRSPVVCHVYIIIWHLTIKPQACWKVRYSSEISNSVSRSVLYQCTIGIAFLEARRHTIVNSPLSFTTIKLLC